MLFPISDFSADSNVWLIKECWIKHHMPWLSSFVLQYSPSSSYSPNLGGFYDKTCVFSISLLWFAVIMTQIEDSVISVKHVVPKKKLLMLIASSHLLLLFFHKRGISCFRTTWSKERPFNYLVKITSLKQTNSSSYNHYQNNLSLQRYCSALSIFQNFPDVTFPISSNYIFIHRSTCNDSLPFSHQIHKNFHMKCFSFRNSLQPNRPLD